MTDKISIAIVGVGNMGNRHRLALQNNDDFHLTALVDRRYPKMPSPNAADAPLRLADYRQLTRTMAEAVVIAAPSAVHAEMGEYFLHRDMHVFMEKPLALRLSDCEGLAALAAVSGVATMVGQIERFNPGFTAAAALAERLHVRPERLVIERFNPASHINDSDVILDLMVHDLDLVLALYGRDSVAAITVADAVPGACGYDMVSLVLRMADGSSVEVAAARRDCCRDARRCWRGEWAEGEFAVDLMRRELNYFNHAGHLYGQHIDYSGDALDAEHKQFAANIRGSEKVLDFADNLAVMRLISHIDEVLKGA